MTRLLKIVLGIAVMQALLFVAAGNASAQCTWKGPLTFTRGGVTAAGALYTQFKNSSGTVGEYTYSSANGQTTTNLTYMKETLAILLTAKATGASLSLCVVNGTTNKFSAAMIRED